MSVLCALNETVNVSLSPTNASELLASGPPCINGEQLDEENTGNGLSTIRSGSTLVDVIYYVVGTLGILGNLLAIAVIINYKTVSLCCVGVIMFHIYVVALTLKLPNPAAGLGESLTVTVA